MMLPLVVVGCNIVPVCQSVREAAHALRRIMQSSPDWQTLLNGIISPSERGWSLAQKQLEGTQKYINEYADRVAHIDGQPMQLLWAHTRFQREYKCLKYKTDNPFTNVCWVSCFNNIFCATQIWRHRQSFLRPLQKRRNDGWWFWCYCCRFVLNSKRLLSTSPVISRAMQKRVAFFMVLFLMLFWSSQNRMCRKLNKP